jgi:hypothetical protein
MAAQKFRFRRIAWRNAYHQPMTKCFAHFLVRFPPGEPRPRGSILIVVVVLAPVKLLYQGSLNLG